MTKILLTRLVFVILSISISYAGNLRINTQNYVNVLSWWGYLDDPRIAKQVENQCGVKLSVDTYDTNEEFIKIYEKHRQRYDVIIFSNLAYGAIKNNLATNKSKLYEVAYNYYPYFKNYYFSHSYPQNVVFFTHAMMGFMYNPQILEIAQGQNIFDIFKNAGSNYALIVDDPAEVRNLLTLSYKTSEKSWSKDIYDNEGMAKLSPENFFDVIQKTHVFITNDFNQIYKLKNFALSFMWSGDALLYIKSSHKPYRFILDPKLSYVCTDLLAQIKFSPQANCVAKVLDSPTILSYVENSTYYFSPYFQDSVPDPSFHNLYEETKRLLPNLSWIEPVKNFAKDNQEWEAIKLKLDEKHGD